MRVLQHINSSNELKRRIAICRKRVRRARATQKMLTMETQCIASPAQSLAENTGDVFNDEPHMAEEGVGAADTIWGAAEDERTGF